MQRNVHAIKEETQDLRLIPNMNIPRSSHKRIPDPNVSVVKDLSASFRNCSCGECGLEYGGGYGSFFF
jgi:hypothetical protein